MRNRFIAFIDILGFENLVRNQESGKSINEIYRNLHDYINDIASASSKPETRNSANETHKIVPERLRSEENWLNNLKISVFSDSILITLESTEVKSKETAQQYMKELRFILVIAQKIQYLLLKHGHVVRGVISHGKIVHYKDKYLDVFYGEKFIHMLAKEKEVKWPMIVLDIPSDELKNIDKKATDSPKCLEKIEYAINCGYGFYDAPKNELFYNNAQFIFRINQSNDEFCINPFYGLYSDKEVDREEVEKIWSQYNECTSKQENNNIKEKKEWLKTLYEKCKEDAKKFLANQIPL